MKRKDILKRLAFICTAAMLVVCCASCGNKGDSEKKSSLSEKTARIAALSPLSVMARGYSIISTDDGHAVTSVENLQTGETLDLRFCDGSAKAQITQITKGDKN